MVIERFETPGRGSGLSVWPSVPRRPSRPGQTWLIRAASTLAGETLP